MHNYRIRTNDIVHTVCMSNHFTASVKTLVLILPMTLIILKCFCITGLCHLVPGVRHPARALPRPPLRPWHPSRRPGTPLGSPLCVAVLKPDWETSRRWTIGRLRCDHDHDEHWHTRPSRKPACPRLRVRVPWQSEGLRVQDCHPLPPWLPQKSGCWASAAADPGRRWGPPAVTRRRPGSSAADSTRPDRSSQDSESQWRRMIWVTDESRDSWEQSPCRRPVGLQWARPWISGCEGALANT